jgi:hypothetical protein
MVVKSESIKSMAARDLRKLLLKCVLSDGEVSRAAFAQWEKLVVFDDLDFQSFKLLPAVYLKLLRHNWESRHFLRIKGAYRRTWAENQLLLTHLHDLFAELNESKIEFIVADETIRLAEIYNDSGIYSLQNFGLIAAFGVKARLSRKVIENGWATAEKNIELSFCQKEKVSNLRIFWVNDAEFRARAKTTGNVLIKGFSRPALSLEEQIINLCRKEFVPFQDEESRWQFIVSEIFNRQKPDRAKLISAAQEHDAALELIEMLQSLKNDFDVNIKNDLIVELRRNSMNKLSSLKRKAKILWQSYRTLKKYGNSKIGFYEFLAQRWNADSKKKFLEHAGQTGIKILKSK